MMFKLHHPQFVQSFSIWLSYLLPRCSVVPLLSVGVKALKRHCHVLKNRESEYRQNKSEEKNPTLKSDRAPCWAECKIDIGKRSKVRRLLFFYCLFFLLKIILINESLWLFRSHSSCISKKPTLAVYQCFFVFRLLVTDFRKSNDT